MASNMVPKWRPTNTQNTIASNVVPKWRPTIIHNNFLQNFQPSEILHCTVSYNSKTFWYANLVNIFEICKNVYPHQISEIIIIIIIIK